MRTISEYYKKQNQEFHRQERERGQPWGQSGRKYYKAARDFAEELEAKTMLDYGCGSSTMKRSFEEKNEYDIEIREYDPGLPEKSAMPEPADFITCTDVLEHVEPEFIDNVFAHINGLANKGAFLVISTIGCNEILPDGTNAHLTIEPGEWWIARVRKLGLDILKAQMNSKRVWIWIKKP